MCFLIFRGNMLCFSFYALLWLSHQAPLWTVSLHLLNTIPPGDLYTHIDKFNPEPSPLQAEESQLTQPFLRDAVAHYLCTWTLYGLSPMHQCLIALTLRSPNQQCARCGLTIAEQRGRITPFGLQRRVARGLEECVPPWHPQLWHRQPWYRQQTTLSSDQISRWVPLSPAAGSHPFAWAHHFIPLILHGLGSDGADF